MKQLTLSLACLLLASVASAQPTSGPPYTTSNALAWGSSPVNGTATQAALLVPRVYVDNASTFTTVTGIVCVAPVAPSPDVQCSAPLTPALVTILNAWLRGAHAVQLSLFDTTTGLESPKSAPFTQTVPPGVPTGFLIK